MRAYRVPASMLASALNPTETFAFAFVLAGVSITIGGGAGMYAGLGSWSTGLGRGRRLRSASRRDSQWPATKTIRLESNRGGTQSKSALAVIQRPMVQTQRTPFQE